MNLYQLIAAAPQAVPEASRVFGVVIGLVTANKDPDGMGRVKVKFPWLSDVDESSWARVATPMAGGQRGLYLLPEVGDEVLVAFDHGDVRFPYVLGGLWNGQDKPPADNADDKNNLRLLRSRSGHLIKLNDEDGKETIEIIDKTGKNKIVFDAAANVVTISSDKDIALKAPQGKVSVDAKELELKSSGACTLEAGGDLTIKGSTVNIN